MHTFLLFIVPVNTANYEFPHKLPECQYSHTPCDINHTHSYNPKCLELNTYGNVAHSNYTQWLFLLSVIDTNVIHLLTSLSLDIKYTIHSPLMNAYIQNCVVYE